MLELIERNPSCGVRFEHGGAGQTFEGRVGVKVTGAAPQISLSSLVLPRVVWVVGACVPVSDWLDAATSERALPIEGVARQVMTTLPNNATAVRPDSVYTSAMSVVLVL